MQLPARYLQPLEADSDGFAIHSKGYRLLALVDKHWRDAAGNRVTLDDWQRFFIINALEVYPPGHEREGLHRHRIVLLSVARQNGKSLLAAILALYLLIQHHQTPNVLGIASNTEQARIVYSRTALAIHNARGLAKIIKPTDTRGLRWKDGRGQYKVLAAKVNSVQGFTGTGVLVDELHVVPRALFDAMVQGMRAHENALMVCLTTAGDDTSETLKALYRMADEAIEDPDSATLGPFIWEGVEGAPMDDPDSIRAANPSIEAGRLSVATITGDDKGSPTHTVKRFTHNLFVKATNAWIDPQAWVKCSGTKGKALADLKGAWIGVDMTPQGRWASIVASRLDPETGRIHTELLATLENPDMPYLKKLCRALRRHSVAGFVIDTYKLRELADHLSQSGHKVVRADRVSVQRACVASYRLIVRSQVRHARDALLKEQMGNGATKNYGDAWRIVRTHDAADIDALMATVLSLWAAEENRPTEKRIQVLKRDAA